MADHHHRPHRIFVPPRASTPRESTPTTLSRQYPLYTYPSSSTPTSTPSKHRLSSFTSLPSKSSKSSISFLFLLLFSLRSLYSLLPFLRSAPSFSLFPFSFLVSLLSFLLSLFFSFGFFSPSPNSQFLSHKQKQLTLGLSSITQSQHHLLLVKSFLLAIVFLLRFQALRYCGTAHMILAEFSGNAVARFLTEGRNEIEANKSNRFGKFGGFLALVTGLLFLSISWDRVHCFPFSRSVLGIWEFSVFPTEDCVRFWPMLLPFLSGFLGSYERSSMNWGTVRHIGQKRVRLISLLYTTVMLFIPAIVIVFVFEDDIYAVSVWNLGWPLANTVVFGVLLTENFSDEKSTSSKDFRREFLVTFVCTVVLELVYFPELSLGGLLLCGILLYFAVRELDPLYSNYVELGMESPESFTSLIMKPIRHILSERKSRKIALFLLINTAYMVVEFVAGFMSNSLGLISDACHMLFDCAALAIGLYASYISRLPANNQFNYGRGRFEVLSGYANAVFLVLVGALIVLESLERILDPQEVSTNSLLTVSIGGLLVNVIGLIFFHEEHHHAHGGGSGSHPNSNFDSHSHHHHGQHSNDHEKHVEHHESITMCLDSTSHTNSDSYLHSPSCGNSHHHQHAHDHEKHVDHHDGITVSTECHGKSCSGTDHQNDNHNGHHHDDGHHQHDHGDQFHSHSKGENHSHADHHTLVNFQHGPQQKELSSEGVKSKVHDHRHRHIDHNMEGIFLHVLADTMGSVGVVISTILIKYKGWLVADPACSIFISVLIVSSVISLLRNSAEILLQRVPRAHEQNLKEAVSDVLEIKGVCGIQSFHVWSFTNSDVVGTVHLRVLEEMDKFSLKSRASDVLHDAGIKDLTLQVESIQ